MHLNFNFYSMSKSEDNLIKEWNSMVDTIKEHPEYNKGSIRSICNGKGHTLYTYKWKYKDTQAKPELKADEIFKNCGIIDNVDFSKYEVSNYGKVKNIKRQKILKNNESLDYYSACIYSVDGKQHRYEKHRLVAELFVKGKSKQKNIVNHIDEDKRNNYYKNFEWVTHKENMEHSFAKAVIMINKKTNKTIKTFKSIANAGEYFGKSSNNISNCCNGKGKTALGYKWKFL
jgi:hypothetical protein